MELSATQLGISWGSLRRVGRARSPNAPFVVVVSCGGLGEAALPSAFFSVGRAVSPRPPSGEDCGGFGETALPEDCVDGCGALGERALPAPFVVVSCGAFGESALPVGSVFMRLAPRLVLLGVLATFHRRVESLCLGRRVG